MRLLVSSSALAVLYFVGSVNAWLACSNNGGRCFCPGREVFCQEKDLPAIPDDISAQTTHLDMRGNVFAVSTLYRSNLTKFRHLTILSLSKCGLELIQADAFADLTSLTRLDLSSNKLLIIEDGTFTGLSLNLLFLHYNLGLFLSENAFANSSIRHLSLRQCGLYELDKAVIAPLSHSLEDLVLAQNKLRMLDENVFSGGFEKLKSISLGGNPWHCSCELRWLKAWHSKNRTLFIQEDLACNSPKELSQFYFSNLHLTDFGCQAPVFEDISIIFHAERAELSCSVGSEAATAVSWLTPSGTRHVYKSAKSPTAKTNDDGTIDRHRITTAKLVVPRPSYTQSVGVELPASSTQLKDTKRKLYTYRCVAGNLAGNVSTSIDVVWPPPVRIHQPLSSKGNAGNTSDLVMLGANPAVCVDTMAIIGAIVGTFALTLIAILIVLLMTRRIKSCLRRRQSESGFMHRRPGRDAPCWGAAGVVMSAGKLVTNGGSLRPGSAGGGGAATPLVLNTSSGSSSSSRQSASGGNISNGGSGSGGMMYHAAQTFHHGGMLSQAANLEELSHFIDTASSPNSGPPMLTLPNTSVSSGFTYLHAPHNHPNHTNVKQMQVSLNSSQLHRPTLR